MAKFTFDITEFDYVGELGFPDGWSNVDHAQVQSLVEALSEGSTDEEMGLVMGPWLAFNDFMGIVQSERIGDEASDHIFSAMAKEGTMTVFSGPAIRQDPEDPEKMVLVIGSNLYRAEMKGGKVVVGTLKGSVTVSESKDNNGKQRYTDNDKPIYDANCLLKGAGKGGDLYEVSLSLNLDICPEFADLAGMVADEESLSKLLKTPSKGGGFVDMRYLPTGEYLCTNITFDGLFDDGTPKFKIHLDGIGPVSPRGASIQQALSGPKVSETQGKWLRLASAARKKGITFNLATHDVEVDGEVYAFPVWASQPHLFTAEKTRHFITGGFFSMRRPHDHKLANAGVVEKMIEAAKVVRAEKLNEGAEPAAITASAEVVEEEQAVLTGVTY